MTLRNPIADAQMRMAQQREAAIQTELALMTAQGRTPDRGWRLALYVLPQRADADGRRFYDDFTLARFPPGTEPWPQLMGGVLTAVYGQ